MISIIVPAYNAAIILGECINSIKAQTIPDFECIVVDDGSQDPTFDTAVWLTKDDPRFKVIRQKNAGCGAARNAGLAIAKGNAVTFVDADDWVEPDYLETLLKASDAYRKVGRIIGIEMVHWPEYGDTQNVWAIAPPGFVPANDPRLFGPACDIGHATACLYLRDRIPFELKFARVKLFEDLILNFSLIFAGVDVHIGTKPIYHYVRRKGSLVTQGLTKVEAGMIRAAFDYSVALYQPPEELEQRFRAFLENTMKGREKE